MNSPLAEIVAIIKKEVLTEVRGRTGLFATLLFAFATVTASGLAAAKGAPTSTLAAGMVWISLLFAAVVGLTRTFLLEEEQRTGDMLRLWANPSPVFWGKLTFNFLLLVAVAVIVVPTFVGFTATVVADGPLLCSAVGAGCLALSATVSLCGAFASRASNKGLVAAVISMPLLLPVLSAGIVAVRVAFGAQVSGGWLATLALLGQAVALAVVGPYLYAAVWKQ